MAKFWKKVVLVCAPATLVQTPVSAQGALQHRPLPFNDPASSCVSYSDDPIATGGLSLKVTSVCANVTVVACTFRPSLGTWDCRGQGFGKAGKSWTIPFAHEQSAIYYVGACRDKSVVCSNSLDWVIHRIDGRPDPHLDPASLRPPVDGEESDGGCSFMVDGRCRAGERG